MRTPAQRRQPLGGQQAHLDLPGDAQLLLEPLLLHLLAQQVLDPARHQVERLGQLAELVARAHRDRLAEVALPEALRAQEERVDAAGDRAGEQEAEHEGARVDHQEDDAHRAERVDEHVGQAAQVARGEARREVPHQLEGLEAEYQRAELGVLPGGPIGAVGHGHEGEAGRALERHPSPVVALHLHGQSLGSFLRLVFLVVGVEVAVVRLHLGRHLDARLLLRIVRRAAGRPAPGGPGRSRDEEAQTARSTGGSPSTMPPKPGPFHQAGSVRGSVAGDGDGPAAADERTGQARVDRPGGLEPIAQDRRRRPVLGRQAEGRRAGDLLEGVGQAGDLGGHEVRGHEVHEEDRRDEEEEGQQDDRHHGDEQVRDDELGAHAPQEAPAGEAQE